MTEQNSGVYNTVMSYIPGTAAYQSSTEDHTKRQDATEEESHKVHQGNTGTHHQGIGTTQGSDVTGQKHDSSFQGGNVGHGHTGLGSDNQSSRTGAQGTQTGSENIGGTGHAHGDQTGSAYNTGNTFGSSGHTHGPSSHTHGPSAHTHGSGGHNVGTESGSDTTYGSGRVSEDAPSNFSSGTTNLGGQYGGNTGQKGGIEYEDDTGTHHSGYKPEGRGQGTTFNDQERTDDGVRGAPIEGENVKGYAIGAPVGSGDTERPNQPGDPSGQVSGAHMEFGPKETDTRDSTGRGTLGQSQGTGDSSFANVKTSDGQGNSSHVVTRSSTSQMHSSSVTQI